MNNRRGHIIHHAFEYDFHTKLENVLCYGSISDVENYIKSRETEQSNETIPEICLRLGNVEMMWYTSRILGISHPKLDLSVKHLERVKNIETIWRMRGKPDSSNSNITSKEQLNRGIFEVEKVDDILNETSNYKSLKRYFPLKSYRGVSRVIFDNCFQSLSTELDIAFFSDTHGNHRSLKIPNANTIVFCGDSCVNDGSDKSIEQSIDFILWFSLLPHRRKLFVPGNHDFLVEEILKNKTWEKYPHLKEAFEKIEFLIGDCAIIEKDGKKLKIYGHPCVPYREGMRANAFAVKRKNMKKHVQIPEDVDVIVTHFPPWGVGDYNTQITRDYTGDSGDLYLRCVSEKLNHKCHVFGHSHNGVGTYRLSGEYVTTGRYINVSSLVVKL